MQVFYSDVQLRHAPREFLVRGQWKPCPEQPARALALQAALLLQHAPDHVGDAFCRARLGEAGGLNYGTLPTGVNVSALIDRATPRLA